MNPELKERLEFRYSKISEIAYFVMLIVVVCIIISSSLGTFLIRKATNTEIILIPDNVYKFIIDVLHIFILPISVKVGGEVFVQALNIWKGNVITNNKKNESIIENTEYSPSEIQKEFDSIYNKTNRK